MNLDKLILTVLSAVAVSCAGGPGSEVPGIPLEIGSVGISSMKSVLASASFPDENPYSIGLFLKASDGVSDYGGHPYSNIEYSKAAGSQSWNMASPVLLTEEDGVLYGYFPYNPSVSGPAAIPVQASINGNDYMYASPVSGLNLSSPSADLSMKHALALVSVTFVRDASYSGPCELTYLSLEGDGFGSSGSLDARDGSLACTPSKVSFSSFSHVVLPEGTTENVLLVPSVVSSRRQDVDMVCVIDGLQYDVALHGDGESGKGVIVGQGVRSSVKLTLKDKVLAISEVSVTEWNSAEGSSGGVGLDDSGLYTVSVDPGVPGCDIDL